jgi:PAS domain S-box-containing protein
MKTIDPKILERAFHREKKARKEAERILESKSTELYNLTLKLKEAKDQVENVLEKRDSELSGLIQNILDPYALVDLSGNILKYNRAAKDLLGIEDGNSSEEPLNLMQFVQKFDKNNMMRAFQSMIDSGYAKDVELTIFDKNKKPVYIQINASLLYDKNGKATSAQGIARDISKIKALQTQTDKLLKDLESNNRELKEYAHVVSHDLKSPLRGISSLVQWIRDDKGNSFTDETPEMFGMITSAIERMDNLISGILRYSTADRVDDDVAELDMYEIIKATATFIHIPKSIDLVISDNMPKIVMSRRKIEQIVQNLMTNAVKFVPKENGVIEWNCESSSEYHLFSISDNGIGIEEKHFDRIFQVFQSLSKSKESTGIGLSIVKKIIKSMNGDIWLESEVGKGTTFYFTIPVNDI